MARVVENVLAKMSGGGHMQDAITLDTVSGADQEARAVARADIEARQE